MPSNSITINGIIGDKGNTAAEVCASIDALVGPIDVYINSKGGSVFDGLAIFNAIRRFPEQVTTHIVGVAASMASVIALAGDVVCMEPNAWMMIHNPTVPAEGDSEDLRSTAGLLDRIQASLAETYATKCGMNVVDVLPLMKAETWFTAAEALETGLIDKIETPAKATHSTPVQQMVAEYRDTKLATTGTAPAPAARLQKELAIMAAHKTKDVKAEDVPAEPTPPVAEPTPTEIQPVDTTSDAYKAGVGVGKVGVDITDPNFVAGIAAGMGQASTEPEEPAEPESKEDDEDKKPVAKLKVADIKAAFGNDREFVFEALEMAEAGKGMTAIKAALADKLTAKVADLQAKLAKSNTGVGPVATAGNVPEPKATGYQKAVADGQISVEGSSTIFRPSYGR